SVEEPVLLALQQRLDAVEGRARAPELITMDAHLSRTALASERIAAVLVGISAGMALALGGLGLYGAMSDAGRQRRREFAVRIAL
ncbi:hypothetical protein, partial [Salmonella enterica]|uniref:hypothetical protein n=1 Tax=Salmonella enterica TaxID=28901 RepID=UPI003CEF2C3A